MKPSVPELTTCCCCVSLRTGAKIFGFFTLVTSTFLFLILGKECFDYFITSENKYDTNVSEFLTCLDFVVKGAQIVTSVLMLMGAYQEKGRLLPPWLVSSAVSALCDLFLITSPLTFHVFDVPSSEHTFPGSWFVFNAILLVDDVYGWLVVYNYYRTLPPNVA